MFGTSLFLAHVQFANPYAKNFGYTKASTPLPIIVADSPNQALDRFLLDPANKDIAAAVAAGTAIVGCVELARPAFPR